MNGAGAGDASTAVVLDQLPHGRSDDDRPQYQKQPLAYVLAVADFQLYECILEEDADISIGDRVALDGDTPIERAHEIDPAGLSSGASAELEYAVEAIVDGDVPRFVDFYNDAPPITTRLHSLNLLPGIGEKLRDGILEERKREPFDSFEDVADRVEGLHDPRQVIVDRILEEIREDDLKYRIFATEE